jgi:site-specific DNA recombinase
MVPMRRADIMHPIAPPAAAPRVALYARYSSDRQSEHSIEDQLRICRAHAERQGWTVVQSFHDAAISGTTLKRPGYQALVRAMRAGELDVVLAEALDRFSRDQEHIAAFHKLVGFTRVRLVTISDGDITALHVGLKGTMNALYLSDLSAKTRRGIEGRVRAGRATGRAPYGYRRVTSVLRPDGVLERGLREVVPDHAAVIRRIFGDYADGFSPSAIARALNGEGIPGPNGGAWTSMTLSGRPFSGDGILRNRAYLGEIVWNRRMRVVDPTSGQAQRCLNAANERVTGEALALRLIDDALWARVQARLAAATPPRADLQARSRFWERRPPRHLLSGKLVCGVCGGPFSANRGGVYSCNSQFRGLCTNTTAAPRTKLEAAVLAILAERMMEPELATAFAETFTQEWNRLAGEQGRDADKLRRELQAVERKLSNLLDALAEGLRSSGLQDKITGLEAERDRLTLALQETRPIQLRLLPNLGQAYRRSVDRLRDALAAGDNPAALEAARNLIDRVVIHPGPRGTPPRITVEGQLARMLAAAQPDLPPHATHAIAKAAVKEEQGGSAPR